MLPKIPGLSCPLVPKNEMDLAVYYGLLIKRWKRPAGGIAAAIVSRAFAQHEGSFQVGIDNYIWAYKASVVAEGTEIVVLFPQNIEQQIAFYARDAEDLEKVERAARALLEAAKMLVLEPTPTEIEDDAQA